MKISFKEIEESEIKWIKPLAKKIWLASYLDIITRNQIDYMLDLIFDYKLVKEQIESNQYWFFIEFQNKKIGFINFYPKDSGLFLSKIYLKKEYQGKGLGKQGLALVVNECKKLQLQSIELRVNKKNSIAIKSYLNFGFTILKEDVLDIGNGFVMDDYILIYNL